MHAVEQKVKFLRVEAVCKEPTDVTSVYGNDLTTNLTVRPVTLESRLPKPLKTNPQETGHPEKGSLRP
jgi:hypothetical protein